MLQHRWNSKTQCKHNHKRLHIVWIHFYNMSIKSKFIVTESRSAVCLGLGVEEGTDWKWAQGNFWEWWKCAKTGLWLTELSNCIFTKNHPSTHLQWAYFMICKLHLNKVVLTLITFNRYRKISFGFLIHNAGVIIIISTSYGCCSIK